MKILQIDGLGEIRMDDPPDYILKIMRKLTPKIRKGALPTDKEALDIAMLKDWLDEQEAKYGNFPNLIY